MVVKGGEFLEAVAQAQCIVFDKTGTLTTGEFRVVRVESAKGFAGDAVLRWAASLESHSEHPLAQAIVAAAAERGSVPRAAESFRALRGLGVEGTVDGQTVQVTSPRHDPDGAGENRANGESMPTKFDGDETVAVVRVDGHVAGAIYLADTLRDDARPAMDDLRRLKIERLVMLTGDRPAAAQRIAGQIGLDEVAADLLPEDKVTRVGELVRRYPYTVMVGDGVNDAPAMAAARVGVALGGEASDTALETSDVVVMAPRLTRIGQLIRLGRRTRGILWQNVALALGIKLVVLVLVAPDLATLWMAVAADVGASLVVIFNGMRLLTGE